MHPKIQFPDLPTISDEEWNTMLSFPQLQRLEEEFLPFAHVELPADTPRGYNELLQRLLKAIHQKNERPFPDYVREFCREGGVSNVYLTDGMMLDHAKAFCYDEAQDRNARGFTGITLCGHMDQKSKTYPLLLIARALQRQLLAEKIPHAILLVRKNDEREIVEAEPPTS